MTRTGTGYRQTRKEKTGGGGADRCASRRVAAIKMSTGRLQKSTEAPVGVRGHTAGPPGRPKPSNGVAVRRVTRKPRRLHDGAAAILVALDILDLESNAGGLGEGFVYAAVLHSRAFWAHISIAATRSSQSCACIVH